MDNFTKIKKVDWLVTKNNRDYTMHDLSVVCLFKPTKTIPSTLFSAVFLLQPEKQFHSLELFQSFAELLVMMPMDFDSVCHYNSRVGFNFVFLLKINSLT